MANQGRLRPVAVYLILLIAVCLLFYYYKEIYQAFRDTIRFFSNKNQVSALVTSFGVFAPLVFMGLQILQILLAPIPGELTGFVGGYLFGAAWGFLYSSIGLSIGSLLAFLISRRLGLPFVRRFIGEELMSKFDYLMEHQGAFFSFLFFLIPGMPKDYFCYLLGLSPMHIFTFFIVSSVGRIPGTLLLSLQGHAVRSEDYRIFFVILGLALFFIILALLYRERVETWLKRKNN